MELYVEELKKIIETMSYTDNVAEFMDSVSELDGVDVDDLEAVAPEVIKKVRSQPNSPFGKETHSAAIITQFFVPIYFYLIHCSIARIESNQSPIAERCRKWFCQFKWTYQRKRCLFTKWSFQCC